MGMKFVKHSASLYLAFTRPFQLERPMEGTGASLKTVEQHGLAAGVFVGSGGLAPVPSDEELEAGWSELGGSDLGGSTTALAKNSLGEWLQPQFEKTYGAKIGAELLENIVKDADAGCENKEEINFQEFMTIVREAFSLKKDVKPRWGELQPNGQDVVTINKVLGLDWLRPDFETTYGAEIGAELLDYIVEDAGCEDKEEINFQEFMTIGHEAISLKMKNVNAKWEGMFRFEPQWVVHIGKIRELFWIHYTQECQFGEEAARAKANKRIAKAGYTGREEINFKEFVHMLIV